ncbi:TolC family protein [Ascidiaceihabitans sp.]|nr:TolC family protein [Ascidiaceihabitans sp.]
MNYIKSAMLTSLFALSACEAPQYSEETLKAQIEELSEVSSSTSKQKKIKIVLSGDFTSDLSRATKYSPEYLAARSNATSSFAQISIAAADLKPQVLANANAGQTIKDGSGLASSKQTGASANLSVKKLIFDGGASAARIDVAQADAFIAEMNTEIVVNNIAKDAAVVWVNLNTLNNRNQLLQALITKTNGMNAQIQTLVTSGMIDKSASASAEIALRALVLEEVKLNVQISEASANFIKYFGTLPKHLSAPTSLLTSSDLQQIQKDWSKSPIMLQSAAKVLAAKQMLIAAQGGQKPTVNFKTGVISPMDRGERTDYAVGLELNWIIGDGGRRKANTAAQAASLKAAEHALAAAKLNGKEALDAILSKRAAIITSIEIIASQEISTQNELEIMWSQLPTGQTSVRQLIEAEEKAYRTSDAKIRVGADLLTLEFEMLAQSGILATKLALDENKKDKALK